MRGFALVLPPRVAERVAHLPPDVKRAVREALRKIADDPLAGESLQRELAQYRKFRVRRYRIVYRLSRRTIRVLAVGHRRTVYEEASETLRLNTGRRSPG
ncbi:MAG: type II toxin-antitoxin system RelE family toxin [Betaproteobacteria bacterium]